MMSIARNPSDYKKIQIKIRVAICGIMVIMDIITTTFYGGNLMARPKGSKNKKSITPVAEVEKQIAAKEKDAADLHSKLDRINAEIKDKQKAAKATKAEIRKVEKALAALKVKKEESEAIEAATAKKAEIEKVVTELISSGKSPEDILSQIK